MMGSGTIWETFYHSFLLYAQSRQLDPQALEEIIEEAHDRITKMLESGQMPPSPQAMFKYSRDTVFQRRGLEQKRLRPLSEISSSNMQSCASKKGHQHPDPCLVNKTLSQCKFREEEKAIIRATCLCDGKSKCPEGLSRPTNRDHARKFGVSHEKASRLIDKFKAEFEKQLLTETFISLGRLGTSSESREEWDKFLDQPCFLGKIAMSLDTATYADKVAVGCAIAKHCEDICEKYTSKVKNSHLLETTEAFNSLLSIEELLFLGCRYAAPLMKEGILDMCKELKKCDQSERFFFDRCLRLLPAYCADVNEEGHWQDLWGFYDISDENERRFSLDALHLHAYNQDDSSVWHRSKDLLLGRSSNKPEIIYKPTGQEIAYTLHAITKAAPAYAKNPSLQRMSLYWAWECFRYLPIEAKKRRDELYGAVDRLSCYDENIELRTKLLNRIRRPY